MFKNFQGDIFLTANNWFEHLNLNKYKNKAINYLEIGVGHGANLISVANTYALHKDSKLYCIDPWKIYDKNIEQYTDNDDINFNLFIKNISNTSFYKKIITRRGFSHLELLHFPDDFFDIIYIDGNDSFSNILEDAVLSYRKLKKKGILIFDEHYWGTPDLSKNAIGSFYTCYYNKIKCIGIKDSQIFFIKDSNSEINRFEQIYIKGF